MDHRPPRRLTTTCLAALLLIGAGCEPSPRSDALLERYTQRIAWTLDRTFEAPVMDPASLQLPRRRLRRLPEADVRAGLFEFLDLNRCGLLGLVSERNSGLGRVQVPSQRLHYELRLLHGLRACLALPPNAEAAEPAFRAWLQELESVKTANLHAVSWNALFAGTEMEALFSQAGTVQALDAIPAVAASTQALRDLAARMRELQEDPERFDSATLETALGRLAAQPAGGLVLRQLQDATHWLPVAGGLLRSTDPARLCPRGQPVQQARILNNVFRKFFVGEVQAWLAPLHREAQAWLEAFRDLHEALPRPVPAPLADFLGRVSSPDHPGGVLQQSRQAVRAQVGAWQDILAACGWLPRPEPSAPPPGNTQY